MRSASCLIAVIPFVLAGAAPTAASGHGRPAQTYQGAWKGWPVIVSIPDHYLLAQGHRYRIGVDVSEGPTEESVLVRVYGHPTEGKTQLPDVTLLGAFALWERCVPNCAGSTTVGLQVVFEQWPLPIPDHLVLHGPTLG